MGQGDTRLAGHSHLHSVTWACAGCSVQGHLFGETWGGALMSEATAAVSQKHSPVQCELE